jgi:N-acyl-D-aspartate/D-glutamate deacylase
MTTHAKTRIASITLTGLLAGASMLAMGTANAANAPADIIITGGTVYTGADQPPTTTDVVIVGDKIAFIGPNAASRYDAKKTINAKGKIVSPGFIDGHAHAEDNLESADAATRVNKEWLYQGATTLLIGVDGGGTAAYFGALRVNGKLILDVGDKYD